MEFKNKDIAGAYQMNGETDSKVQMPGYRGQLSEISNPELLDGMISRGSKLVSKREAVKPMAKEPARGASSGQ